jgi:hypothetical protein
MFRPLNDIEREKVTELAKSLKEDIDFQAFCNTGMKEAMAMDYVGFVMVVLTAYELGRLSVNQLQERTAP